jgi:hypothetical protein
MRERFRKQFGIIAGRGPVPATIGDVSPIFYSALERGLQGVKQETAPAQQWINMIDKLPVKAEELDWTGLKDWLSEQPGKVTKQQILDHIQEENVQLVEIRHQDDPDAISIVRDVPADWWRSYFDEQGDYGPTATMTDDEVYLMAEFEVETGVLDINDVRNYELTLEEADEALAAGTRIHVYDPVLNRAVLEVHHPETIGSDSGIWEELRTGRYRIRMGGVNIGGEAEGQLIEGRGSLEGIRQPEYGSYQYEGPSEDYREIVLTVPTGKGGMSRDWQAPHFHQIKNIVVHVRFNTRVGPKGEKILFIEEIQSDLHQEARRARISEIELVAADKGISIEEAAKLVPENFGYDTAPAKITELPDNWRVRQIPGPPIRYVDGPPAQGPMRWVAEELIGGDWIPSSYNMTLSDAFSPGDIENYPHRELAEELLLYHLNRDAVRNARKFPDAPFKKSWPLLALKRVVRHAAENGYDVVAWTPGIIQVNRYQDALRKQVDNITWTKAEIARAGHHDNQVVHGGKSPGEVMDWVHKYREDFLDEFGRLKPRYVIMLMPEGDKFALYDAEEPIDPFSVMPRRMWIEELNKAGVTVSDNISGDLLRRVANDAMRSGEITIPGLASAFFSTRRGAKPVAKNYITASKNGSRVFWAEFDDNGMIVESSADKAIGQDVDDVVGKEIGKRVREEASGDISGDDLTVGGEGMKGFYDRMLPAMVTKFFGKKAWGSPRVGKIVINKTYTEKGIAAHPLFDGVDPYGDNDQGWFYEYEDEENGIYLDDGPFDTREEAEDAAAMDFANYVAETYGHDYDPYAYEIEKNLDAPHGNNWRVKFQDGTWYGGYDSRQAAELAAPELVEAKKTDEIKGTEVWALPITDKMRAKAKTEGFPLFDIGRNQKKNEDRPVFQVEDVKSVELRQAIEAGLISDDEGAVIDGIMEIFPDAWKDHFEARFSEQSFAPDPRQSKAHGLTPTEGLKKEVKGVLLTEKVGALKEDARHIAVMFRGASVDTFLHEFGEFAYARLLTKTQADKLDDVLADAKAEWIAARDSTKPGSKERKAAKRKWDTAQRRAKEVTKADKIIVRDAYKKYVKRLEKRGKTPMAENEWFSDGFRDWWMRNLNGDSTVVGEGLRAVFRKVLAAVKEVWRRLKSIGKRHPLDHLFEDIIVNGRDLNEKYYYSAKEVVSRYIIGQDASREDLAKQGFAYNGKTFVSWDPGTMCPKKRSFLEYVARNITPGGLEELRMMAPDNEIWEELLNPDLWIRMYQQAVNEGVDVPCSYCYVEQSRRVAVDAFNRGKNITDVIAAKAKPIYETTPYRDAILKWTDEKIADLNARGGLRLFSFGDYVREWHYDNVKLLLKHAKMRGLAVKAITKVPAFVEDFAHTGITINVSVDNEPLGIEGGMDWDEALRLKRDYGAKVRTVAMNLNDFIYLATLRWKGVDRFMDVITPYHHEDHTKGKPPGATNFAFRVENGKIVGSKQHPGSQELIDWIEAHPEYEADKRTCCLVGGKCFNEAHQKQCGSNCGGIAGALTIPDVDYFPAQVGEPAKTTIRRTTGQSRTEAEYTERDNLKAAIKMAARNARIAYASGKTDAVAAEKARVKAMVERAREQKKLRGEADKIRAKLKRALKQTKVKKQSGKPKGRYGADVQQLLDRLRGISMMSGKTARAKLEENLLASTQPPSETNPAGSIPPIDIAMENRMLALMSTPLTDVTEVSVSEWQNLLDDVMSLKAGAEAKQLMRAANRMAYLELAAAQMIDILGGIPEGIETTGEDAAVDDTLKTRIRNALFASRLSNYQQGWKDLLDILSYNDKTSAPGQSIISQFGDVLDAKNAEKKGGMAAMEQLREIAMEAFGLKSDRQLVKKFGEDAVIQDLGTFKNLKGEIVNMKMSRAQARKRMMEIADPTLHGTIFDIEGMAWTQEMVDAVNDFLTDQDRDFIVAQLGFYQEYYAGVDEVYSDIFGVHLPHNPLYSPIVREGVNRDEDAFLGEFLKEVPFRATATQAGSLKTRVENRHPLKLRNDIEVLLGHVTEMEHFKAWAHKVRDLNAVFSHPGVRQAIRINFGKSIDKHIQSFLQDFGRGGIETSKTVAGLDRLRSKYTRAVLAIKPSIFIKQLTSFVAYADAIPVTDYAKYLAKTFRHPVEAGRQLMKSTLMQHRWKSGEIERDIKTMMATAEFQKLRANPSLMNMLAINVRLGDIGAIIMGGHPVYAYHYDRLVKQGMAPAEAEAQALRIFESITESTQQSSDLSEQSALQRGGSFAKLFTMFKSSPNQYFRKEMAAIRNFAAGRIGKRQLLKTILIYHIILPMFFQWVSDRFTWDEDEQLRAMILGPLNGIFILGDALDYLVRDVAGMQTWDLGIPLWSFIEDVGKALELLDPSELDAEDFLRAIRGLAGAVGVATGTPAKQGVDIATGFSDLLSGEYEVGLAEVMGYSPYTARDKAED